MSYGFDFHFHLANGITHVLNVMIMEHWIIINIRFLKMLILENASVQSDGWVVHVWAPTMLHFYSAWWQWRHGWKNVAVWNLIPRKFYFLKGNLCNFERKFFILMDVYVFLFKNVWIYFKSLTDILTIFIENFPFFFQPWVTLPASFQNAVATG